MKNESITPNNMKSLIILAFLLLAGFMPGALAQEQVKTANTGGNTGRVRDMMFPTFQKDIADLNRRSAFPAPDRNVVSTDTKKRLFTNYQPPRSAPAPRLLRAKTKPMPSDSAAVAIPDNQARKQAAPIPSQDGGASPKKH